MQDDDKTPNVAQAELEGIRQATHDLSNTLGAILGYITLLERRVKDDPEALQYAEKIRASTYKALDDLEQFTRSEPPPETQRTPSATYKSVQATTLLPRREPAPSPIGIVELPLSEAELGLGPVMAQPSTGPVSTEFDGNDLASPNQSFTTPPQDDLPEGFERILLVDDDELFRKMLNTFLRQQGYEVLSAIDGEEALRIYDSQKEDIDLVILDRYLPKKNGLEVARHIRQSTPKMRLVVLSGLLHQESDPELRQLRVSAVLQKTSKLRDLSYFIRSVLDDPPPPPTAQV